MMIKSTRDTRKLRKQEQCDLSRKNNTKMKDVTDKLCRAALGDITNATEKTDNNKVSIACKKSTKDESKQSMPGPCIQKKAPNVSMASKASKALPVRAVVRAAVGVDGRQRHTVKPCLGKSSNAPRQLAADKPFLLNRMPHLSDDQVVKSNFSDQHDVEMTERSSAGSPAMNCSSHTRMSLDKSMSDSFESVKDGMPVVPNGVDDIDAPDVFNEQMEALYAHGIFLYYKRREVKFVLAPYLEHQTEMTELMRSTLVDWLVEVQETFELNHETLYLAVKLVDDCLSKLELVPRRQLQLLAAAAMFIAAKFDERLPPAIDDFLYICDKAYTRDQFTAMERDVLGTVDYDLGRPISYRFLRRYAKCGHSPVKTLYMGRYLLEMSLMDYSMAFESDSRVAAACLYIARRMLAEEPWTRTLEFYSGYAVSDLRDLVPCLNALLDSGRFPDLGTSREKYNHRLFHSVGLLPHMSDTELLADTPDLLTQS